MSEYTSFSFLGDKIESTHKELLLHTQVDWSSYNVQLCV